MLVKVIVVIAIHAAAVQAWTDFGPTPPEEHDWMELEKIPKKGGSAAASGEDLTECFLSGTIWGGELVKNTRSSFFTVGMQECWKYCRLIFHCEVFTFQITTGNCSLYTDLRFAQNSDKSDIVISSKHCMEKTVKLSEGANIVDIVLLSESKTGFLIQQDLKQLACLAVGKVVEGAESKVWRLTWKPCGEGTRWLLHDIVPTRYRETLYQISPSTYPGMCLDVPNENYTQIFLVKCRNLSLGNLDDPQTMYITENLESYNAYNKITYSIFSKAEKYASFHLLTSRKFDLSQSLDGVSFRDPAQYEQTHKQLCTLNQYSTQHGTVRNPHNVPFFLSGQEVEVKCEQGYGVKYLNYSTVQTLLCGAGSKPLPCVRLLPRKSCKGRNREEEGVELERCLFLVVAIVSSTVAVVLLVMMLRSRRKMGREERKGEETTVSSEINVGGSKRVCQDETSVNHSDVKVELK